MNRLATLRAWILTLRREWAIIGLMTVTTILAGAFSAWVIWPGYANSSSRIFTSRLGYASLLRSQNKPFPVTCAVAQRREMKKMFMGEGLVQSEPIQAPVIPMGRILKVHAAEGDYVRKGQLLAELDDARAVIKIQAAHAAITTAKAELERTRIGSAYVLDQERPERDKIRLQEFEEEAEIKAELAQMAESLLRQNALSRGTYLLQRLDAIKSASRLKQTQRALHVAEAGREHSLQIAQAALAEAELALAHRQHELREYKVYAPADGIVERCLIHEGEYNQDPGKPAFLIASGIWFTAHLDQTSLGKFQPGDAVEVHLEAFPGRILDGHVSKIHPVVSYNLGGPETSRPVRPLGTGAPEWPATFPVRVQLQATETSLVPGLTGFARVKTSRLALAVPQAAVQSVSGTSGIVFVVDGKRYEPREVSLGYTCDGWTEVRSGVSSADELIVDGHQVLEPGDLIEPTHQAGIISTQDSFYIAKPRLFRGSQ